MKKIFFLCLLLTAVNAYADKPNLVWCDSCSPTQMQAAAAKAGLGITYVGDPISRVVNAYQTYIDVEDTNPPTRTRETYQISSDPADIASIDAAIDFHNWAPVGWKKRVEVYTNRATANDVYADDPDANVYDVVNAGRHQNMMNAWLNSGINPLNTGVSIMGHAIQGLGTFRVIDGSTGPALSVPINFSDGSYVQGKFNTTTGKLEVDPSTALDSHGNTVPYLGKDGLVHGLGGQRSFDGNGNPLDQNFFLNQLNTLNVPVFFGSLPIGQHGWACIKSGDGPKAVWTCQLH